MKFDFIDGILMVIAIIFSYLIFKGDGVLAIFYGWIFATGILFAIKISFKDGFTLKRFKRKS